MFDEPDEPNDRQAEGATDPATKAKEKADEFRMHAELCAVFEGNRKYDAQIVPGLDPDAAREVQRGVARLEKARSADSPVLPDNVAADATALLEFPDARGLSTNDYHVHRRPGEVMAVRWLAGDQVATYYERLQAHFDAALEGFKEDERQAHEWKQDPAVRAYLSALDKVEVKMAERYLREPIRTHNLFVLSTQTADEINIAHLCDYIMGIPAAELVGAASAPPQPPDEPTEQDLAWFFKLFSLRGVTGGVERMCFFAFLQKTDDSFGDW